MYCSASATLAITSSSRITDMVFPAAKGELGRKSIKSRAWVGSESLHYTKNRSLLNADGVDGASLRHLEFERPRAGRRRQPALARHLAVTGYLALAGVPTRTSAAYRGSGRPLRHSQGAGRPRAPGRRNHRSLCRRRAGTESTRRGGAALLAGRRAGPS